MKSPDMGAGSEVHKGRVLIEQLRERASTASKKIRDRIESVFVPSLEQMPGTDDPEDEVDTGKVWLATMRNDFHYLAKDPNDPTGGGHYEGWTPEEIKELYFVLYGEELE